MATKFVNQVNFDIPTVEWDESVTVELPNIFPHFYASLGLIPEEERLSILGSLAQANWQPVSITGMSGNWNEGDPIGSYRASNYTPEYAAVLWERIKPWFPAQRAFTDADNTDWDGHEVWEPIGVSPLLRFIKYHDGGWLVVHYDAPYVKSEDVRTLQSLVIHLDHSDTITGGRTRFLNDPQAGVPVAQRDLNDQKRAAEPEEIHYECSPPLGSGVIFDHRTLHDAELVQGEGQKIIIRTDIMYRKVK